MYFHGFENGGALLTLGLILTSSAMVLWFRGATVRLYVKLFQQKPSNSFKEEAHLTDLGRRTLFRDNSLSETDETGLEQTLDLALEHVVIMRIMGYS